MCVGVRVWLRLNTLIQQFKVRSIAGCGYLSVNVQCELREFYVVTDGEKNSKGQKKKIKPLICHSNCWAPVSLIENMKRKVLSSIITSEGTSPKPRSFCLYSRSWRDAAHRSLRLTGLNSLSFATLQDGCPHSADTTVLEMCCHGRIYDMYCIPGLEITMRITDQKKEPICFALARPTGASCVLWYFWSLYKAFCRMSTRRNVLWLKNEQQKRKTKRRKQLVRDCICVYVWPVSEPLKLTGGKETVTCRFQDNADDVAVTEHGPRRHGEQVTGWCHSGSQSNQDH